VWDLKLQAVLAYRSQFIDDPQNPQPETALSRPDFLWMLEARARFYGALIRARYGEAFVLKEVIPVRDLVALLGPPGRPRP